MKRLTTRAKFLIGFVLALWLIEGLDLASNHLLDTWGALRPRSEIGLAQIFSAPFLHANVAHLLGNTTALIPLGILMLAEGAFLSVMWITIAVGGLGTWLFASGPTLGFSIVLFGFMGFLIARGFYTKQPRALLWSVLVLCWFGGGVVGGLIPHAGISWAGHFWGFVGGGLAAKHLPRRQGKF